MADPAVELPKAVRLAVSSPLPKPVGSRDGKAEARGESTDKENGLQAPALQPAPRAAMEAVSAAYQALPVTANAITQHLTPALPVIEHGKLTAEVRRFWSGAGD